MIISKDLFIFGEHLFGTILPESSNSTNTTSTSQQTLLQLPPTTIVLPSSTASATSSSSSALFTPLSSCSIEERGAVANNIITPATSPSSQVLSSQQQQPQQQHKHCNCYRHYQHRQQQQQHQLLPINNLITLKRNNGDDSNDTTITIQQSTMRYINEELSQQRQSVNMTTNYKHMSNIDHHPHDEAVSLLTNNKTKTTTMEVNDISVKEQCKDCVLQEQNDMLKRSAAVSYSNGGIEQNHLKPTSTVTIQNPVNNNISVDNNTTTTAPLIIETQRTLQLSFQNLTIMHNDRKILDDISGGVSPAEILAIMGPSGSGKTTLLDCLSGQRRLDRGTIFVNRELLSKKWRRKICYVLQEEIFFAGLTLRETLTYTALLRLPEHLPKSQKINLVEEILQAFDLTFCQHTKFGDYLNRGLSGGEKKRANIACELLTSPLLMLLDEPTSGLDSHSAVSLMKMLKRYATQEQKTVVITVHQPSSQMFHMFDKLLLLFNGRTAYFGEANSIYRYFENIGVIIKPRYNPAEFLLEQLKSYPDVREKLFLAAKESLGNYFNGICLTLNENHKNHSFITNCSKRDHDNGDNKDGIKHDALLNDIINNYYKTNHHGGVHHHHQHHHHNIVIHQNSCVEDVTQQLWYGGADTQSNISSTSSDYPNNDWLDYPTGFYTQFYVLSERNFKEAKPRMLSKLNWLQTVGLALMAGAIWFRIPRTEEYLHDLQGWMFFSQTYWMLFALFGALNSFPAEREIINKERRSGAYRLSAYYLAKMFAELPLIIALPTIYLMISYPMLGCPSVKLFLLMLAFLLLNTIVAQSVGFFIGACCMDMNFSITLSALYTLATQLFGGYLSTRIPDCLSWIRYTSMIHYAYQNMQILEFSEAPFIECGHPSSYEVCKNNGTLYIPYEEILKAQNSTSPLWLNTVVLLIFFMVFRSFGYIVLRYIRCPKM